MINDEQSYQNPNDLNYDDNQGNNEIPPNNNINMEENYSNDNENENDNYNDNENGQYSDTSSNNESLLSGVTLIKKKGN